MSTESNSTDPNRGAVRGHVCDGLRAFADAATYVCIPAITSGGIIASCDDSNPVPILFGPWCGVELGEARVNGDETP
jgi:hypothetical protein